MNKILSHSLKYLGVCLILAGSFFFARCVAAYSSAQSKNKEFTIVVDAGHGGADPGKVGIDNLLEKDLNLSIALKVAKLFEKKGYNVILTRKDDSDLADEDSVKRKSDDLKNRITLIEDSNADLTVCIHQNSFPDESVHGPQVFYYSDSEDSKELATIVQNEIDESLEVDKSRGIKSNSDYYLLKKSPTPTIIVECGFLSNPTEAQLLSDDSYQEKLARAIYIGIYNYIKRCS